MDASINGDLEKRASVDANAMDWSSSPSPTVWRKRLHRVGPAEAGQVTSVVRYEPNSSFPIHDHPEGEEILVLEGVFSDEHGNWPAGTYLLNPEGFRHAPFSIEGCVILVKLRQSSGLDREHVAMNTCQLDWQPGGMSGIEVKPLYSQEGYSDTVQLERWAPGTSLPTASYEKGVEFFVLDGTFEDELGSYPKETWLRLPVGASHQPRSTTGCDLWVKRSGFPYLKSETAA
jgi:anti-sigma factor ChrR (cupin superfamily)